MKTMIEQLQEVEQRLKHEKSRRMFERYQTVRLHLLGKDNAEIATSIGRKDPPINYRLMYMVEYDKLELTKCIREILDVT
jgi:hypothetical protein